MDGEQRSVRPPPRMEPGSLAQHVIELRFAARPARSPVPGSARAKDVDELGLEFAETLIIGAGPLCGRQQRASIIDAAELSR